MATSPNDEQIKAAILALIAKRGAHSSACPSEVARSLSDKDWRALMPRIRQIAWHLMQLGKLDILQGGVPISAMDAVVGPIRIRLAQPAPSGDVAEKK